jgi:orotate phosphoribosyltransferase-like protein
MSYENPSERSEAAAIGGESADILIAQTEELLEGGLYDAEAAQETRSMLNTARLLTQNPETRKKIDDLLVDIASRYGDQK